MDEDDEYQRMWCYFSYVLTENAFFLFTRKHDEAIAKNIISLVKMENTTTGEPVWHTNGWASTFGTGPGGILPATPRPRWDTFVSRKRAFIPVNPGTRDLWVSQIVFPYTVRRRTRVDGVVRTEEFESPSVNFRTTRTLPIGIGGEQTLYGIDVDTIPDKTPDDDHLDESLASLGRPNEVSSRIVTANTTALRFRPLAVTGKPLNLISTRCRDRLATVRRRVITRARTITEVRIENPPLLGEVEIGATHRLRARVISRGASQQVTWRSSDESIAAVNEATGMVMGIREDATVTITATSVARPEFYDTIQLRIVPVSQL